MKPFKKHIAEAFNFRPKDAKEIKSNEAIPKDWQEFITEIWKMFGETVVFQTTGKLNKKGEVSGDALAGKIRPDAWFKIKAGTKKIGKGFKVEFNPKGTTLILSKKYGEWDYSINLVAGLGSGTKGPTGAQWESLITHQLNILLGQPDADKNAAEIANPFYPVYLEPAMAIATAFNKTLGAKTIMTQFGASSGSLSKLWKKHGAGNATPKTDMYTKNFNVSLKKAGGSQLASGGREETLATFYAALEYMGKSKSSKKAISSIMNDISKSFTKVAMEYGSGELETLAGGGKVGKKGKADLSPKDKKELKRFSETEQFHKNLNETLKKTLNFDKNPEFLKWFIFEAMSGYKKFDGAQSSASVCVTFDPDDGNISLINVTNKGTSKGLSGLPTPSKELIAKASKVKVYSAWKSSGTRPYSTLRVSGDDHTKDKETLVDCTLNSIIRDEIMLDEDVKSLGLNLTEEIVSLDEFALIKSIASKLKQVGKDSVKWVNGFFKKVTQQVNKVLLGIMKLGERMFEGLFEFLGIEVSATASVPNELADFVNK